MLQENRWSIFNPTSIYLESNLSDRLADFVKFSRVAILTSSGFVKRGKIDQICSVLPNCIVNIVGDIKPNPTISQMDAHVKVLRLFSPEVIVAIGGGSVIDTAKVASRLLTQLEDATLARYYSADTFIMNKKAIPVIAIPTTAGTGSEVTPFATVWGNDQQNKYSLSGSDLYPKVALLDPALLSTLPADIIVTTGLDAISHAFESIWNHNANCITIGYATASLNLSLRHLEHLAFFRSNYPDAPQKMMEASLLAGLAISRTKTALSHAISYPITAKFGVPHGIAASFTLPEVLNFNSVVDDGRLLSLSESLGFNSTKSMSVYISDLLARLNVKKILRTSIPSFSSLYNEYEGIVSNERSKNNMRKISSDELNLILRNSLFD